MSLSRYALECRKLIEELIQSLTKEDAENLRQSLGGVTQAAWQAWTTENSAAISRYAAASPSERKKRKEWAEPGLHKQLVLAAIQHLQRGEALLLEISHNQLEPGIGYRSMAAAAGDAYQGLLKRQFQDWPFDGPRPFPDE